MVIKERIAPSFNIKINNSLLSTEKQVSIKHIKVQDRLNAPSRFFITVSDDKDIWLNDYKNLIGSECRIRMGHKDDTHEVMAGEITELKVNFDFLGKELIICGRNRLHRMENCRKTNTYNNMSYDEIIQDICNQIDITPDLPQLGPKHDLTVRRNLSDYEFILDIADKFCGWFNLQDRNLSWEEWPPQRDEDIVLEWNKSLLEFYPICNTIDLVSKVEVQGWDPTKQKPIVKEVNASQINSPGGIEVDKNIMPKNAKAVIVDYDLKSVNEVEKRAEAALKLNNATYIKARGKINGNEKIRGGTIIRLEGISEKFCGKYMTIRADHYLDPETGYSTRFEVYKI